MGDSEIATFSFHENKVFCCNFKPSNISCNTPVSYMKKIICMVKKIIRWSAQTFYRSFSLVSSWIDKLCRFPTTFLTNTGFIFDSFMVGLSKTTNEASRDERRDAGLWSFFNCLFQIYKINVTSLVGNKPTTSMVCSRFSGGYLLAIIAIDFILFS